MQWPNEKDQTINGQAKTTDNKIAKRKITENKMTKRKRTENKMAKRNEDRQ
jgi:hypothetical protein